MEHLQIAILVVSSAALLAGLAVLAKLFFGSTDADTAARALNETEGRISDAFQKASTDTAARIEQVKGDLRTQLTKELQEGLAKVRETVDKQLTLGRGEQAQRLSEIVASLEKKFENLKTATENKLDALSHKQTLTLRESRDELTTTLKTQTESNEKKLSEIRTAIDNRLTQIQKDNAEKLESMRKTVDEKLQGTLEKRLGESFKQVSERLEQVHKGLGEMQSLANGVGDLKKVLTNVKTRGSWGEMQLGNLLAQLLPPEQYAVNVATRPNATERVEFAIRLPGRDDREGSCIWLPIDAKFPKEDYERLIDAADRAAPDEVEAASKQLENRIKLEAKSIREKYIEPPHTTDFGVLYLPTEGLYAEVLRRPGLVDSLQRDYRVTVAGPTVLSALLNSLQMGFRTLAIEKRSSEVWEVLGAVKTEFGKFGGVLAKVHKKLQEASNVVDQANVRTRAMKRKLRDVQELPATEATRLLETGLTDESEEDNL